MRLTALRTFLICAGVPCCATLASAARACFASWIGYLRSPGTANDLLGNFLRFAALSFATLTASPTSHLPAIMTPTGHPASRSATVTTGQEMSDALAFAVVYLAAALLGFYLLRLTIKIVPLLVRDLIETRTCRQSMREHGYRWDGTPTRREIRYRGRR